MARGGRPARRRRALPHQLRAGYGRERHRRGLPRRARGAPAVTDLLSLAPDAARAALTEWLDRTGEAAYRIRQVLPRLWQRPVARWADATDLPAALRAALDREFPLARLEATAHQVSKDGTEKFLWKLADGEAVESVLIPEGRRRTLCISSQVGCALGCVFCATGRMGWRRDLSADEIAGQVRAIIVRDPHQKPTNVVFMGMGEPLLNWEAVDVALTILNHGDGLGIGARHITVSTVGILPSLAKFAQRPEQFRLALSLHASVPALRRDLMPIEKKYALPDVMKALAQFSRRVTLEYVLIGGVNDSLDTADRLVKLAKPLGALVNLLPLHPGGAPGLTPSPHAQMLAFERRLKRSGVAAVLRRSRGLDISAACGQLRVELGPRRRKVGAEEHAGVE
ncbi:MAG: 23S rRNA (adenine(2503)-C(2))-methyltransferase RlmN [Gemmatimonadetes bacterium]|nr:MAG: 23S rRNA (adenine(2503)-C(2))-methyltransferase RlmN [Gemmatimonadota bacterium]